MGSAVDALRGEGGLAAVGAGRRRRLVEGRVGRLGRLLLYRPLVLRGVDRRLRRGRGGGVRGDESWLELGRGEAGGMERANALNARTGMDGLAR